MSISARWTNQDLRRRALYLMQVRTWELREPQPSALAQSASSFASSESLAIAETAGRSLQEVSTNSFFVVRGLAMNTPNLGPPFISTEDVFDALNPPAPPGV